MDLRTWFDRLTAAKVQNMTGEAEGQHLDCKIVRDEADMKRNLAKVISGFANAEGGVCLWGVDARKNAEGIDCVIALPGVKQARPFAARLDELSSMACSPGVVGVVHRPLAKRGAQEFVATYVPVSDAGPHMAGYGEDRYYLRIGASFIRMQHFQLADMFGRRARPLLEVTAEPDPSERTHVRIRITNSGRGAAQAPFIVLGTDGPFSRNSYGVDGNRNERVPYMYTERDGRWLHAGGLDLVIHPTMSVLVGGVWLGFDPTSGGRVSLPSVCTLRYQVGALGIAPFNGTITVPIH